LRQDGRTWINGKGHQRQQDGDRAKGKTDQDARDKECRSRDGLFFHERFPRPDFAARGKADFILVPPIQTMACFDKAGAEAPPETVGII
jgi:hypothetical protein